MGNGKGVSASLQPTMGSGEHRKLPQWGSRQNPSEKMILLLSKCVRMPLIAGVKSLEAESSMLVSECVDS